MSLTSLRTRRLAASSALVFVAGAGVGLAGPAQADPGASGPGQGQAQAQDHGKGKHKGKKHRGQGQDGANGNGQRGNHGKGPRGNNGHGNGHGNGHANGHGNGANGNGGSNGGSSTDGGSTDGGSARGGSGDPAGNNGTVKIAPLGDFDGIPNNTPHPGCTFLVEWYGFDEGADVVSTVTFAMQAPTSDVGVAVGGPSEVFVGEDPASGAGTDSGLDARQAYTLSFDGEPHPKQGYHVKLTVNTPRSNGADKKSKVFWVEPCESAPAAPGGDSEGSSDEGTGDEGTGTEGTGTEGTDEGSGVAGISAGGDTADGAGAGDQGVMGEAQGPGATGDDAGGAAGADDDAAVPTSVDAGDGNPMMAAFTSPWALAALALGLLTAAGAFLLRRRATV